MELLRRAQAWLEPASEPGACPSADELYDFGRGPGARPLPAARRAVLEQHVTGCEECSGLVATLAVRPPAPLIDREAPGDSSAPARRRWRRLSWIPLAAAAAAAIAFFWPREPASHAPSGGIRFPAPPVLRGAADDALLFPRDRVLRSARDLFASPVFELAARERAASYRVRVSRHDGGAFADGQLVATLTGTSHTIDASTLRAELRPGHYTWEAWAVVDGLDVPLGRRDFEVVIDDRLVTEIDARRAAPEPARSESILHLLHDAGFAGDARAFARSLPATPERDAYLARVPGR